MKWLVIFIALVEYIAVMIMSKFNIVIPTETYFFMSALNVVVMGWIFYLDDYIVDNGEKKMKMEEEKRAAERFVIFDKQKNIVDKCPNLEAAKKLVRKLEIEDMTDGVYEIGWYSILDSEKLVFIDKENK